MPMTRTGRASGLDGRMSDKLDTSPWLQERSWPAIEAYLQDEDTVLLPVGATEQHGYHLPLLVDSAWAIAACDGAARKSGVLIAPPQQVGWSPHHLAYPGSLTLRPETLTQVVLDIGESLVVSGFKRLIIVNGNRIANLPPLEIAGSKLRHRTGCLCVIADVGLIAKQEIAALRDGPPGSLDHAGESETAFMMAWQPDLVALERAEPYLPPRTSSFNEALEFEPEYEGNSITVIRRAADRERVADGPAAQGISGDPTLAKAEKGEAILDAIVTNLCRLIDELRTQPTPHCQADIPS